MQTATSHAPSALSMVDCLTLPDLLLYPASTQRWTRTHRSNSSPRSWRARNSIVRELNYYRSGTVPVSTSEEAMTAHAEGPLTTAVAVANGATPRRMWHWRSGRARFVVPDNVLLVLRRSLSRWQAHHGRVAPVHLNPSKKARSCCGMRVVCERHVSKSSSRYWRQISRPEQKGTLRSLQNHLLKATRYV